MTPLLDDMMCKTGSSPHPILHRRTLLRTLLAGAGVMLCSPAWRVVAQPVTPAASQAPDLASLFPDERKLPGGMELESAGTREEIGQLAGTFRNSRDAAQLLASWGWVGNAYRSYAAGPGAGPATPARLEISLHQFRSSTGAAYALSYFAHDRAVALHHQEEPNGLLLPCEATVVVDGSATRYLRSRNLLVRVTVVMPRPGDPESDDAALATATSLALAVLTQAGSDAQAMNGFC
jgi:hypothetical protein